METFGQAASALKVYSGLLPRLKESILGQDDALRGLSEALLAGELGHTPPGRPRSLILVLGPTGTGKTRSVLESSRHLFGTESIARIDGAEYSSEERLPLLLGTAQAPGLLGRAVAEMRARGGRILLVDEIEKASPKVSDYLLGMEEAALTLAGGERLDLSDLHIVATSNVGSSGVVEMAGVARSSVRRYVEQEAAARFRPEVLARFTSILVFAHLPRELQSEICGRMLEGELALQSRILSEGFGHPHRVRAGPAVRERLAAEGWHRRLGARPMRNVIERRVRTALVEARLRGSLGRGVSESVLVADGPSGIRLGVARLPITL